MGVAFRAGNVFKAAEWIAVRRLARASDADVLSGADASIEDSISFSKFVRAKSSERSREKSGRFFGFSDLTRDTNVQQMSPWS